ncbi:hypothetical protein BV210_05830 [Halorientalis sp. IM1011]|nr:hypothetical protein BV210_05830 [Halorientalis sp. IM1011]
MLLVATCWWVPGALTASESQGGTAIAEVGAAGDTTVGAAADGWRAPVGVAAAQESDGDDNESTRHEDPDEAGSEGDLEAVSRWLQGELADRLGGSAINLSQGQYEQASEILGDGYDERLDQFVDVAGETDGDEDDEQAETYGQAQENQSSFVDAVERYREGFERYREAREQGNATRARMVARTLREPAQRIRDNGSSLRRLYGRLSESPNADLSEATTTIERLQENVSSQQSAIEAAVFVGTSLTVEAGNGTASFDDPLTITGRLATENGTAVADHRTRFTVAGRSVTTTTDADGRFSFEFRPTTQPVGSQSLDVAFAPADASRYLRSTDTVDATIEPVEPSVTVTPEPTTVSFADDLTVTGRVGADGVGAPDVPVEVTLGDERLGVVRTDADGGFRLNATVPATVLDGSRTVAARVAQDDRALTAAGEAATVTVESTPTSLSLDAESNGTESVDVDGTLRTAEGRAVPEQRLRVLVDGSVATTVRTDGDGRFAATASVPGTPTAANGTASVSVVYQADGTNLEASRANATVTLGPAEQDGGGVGGDGAGGDGGDDGTGSLLSGWLLPIVAVVLLVLVALGGAAAYLWREREAGDGSDDDPIVVANAVDTEEPSENGADTESTGDASPLAAARERFDEGETDAAVMAAYAAVRDALAAEHDVPADGTHREVYAAVTDALDESDRTELEQVIDSYERAAFAQSPVPTDRAERTLDRAATILEDREAAGN